MRPSTVFAATALVSVGSAYNIPANLKKIYDSHKARRKLPESSFWEILHQRRLCGDIPNAIFLKSNGAYDNMDIDCDGVEHKAGDCSNDPSGYGETVFKSVVQSYGISDLNANIHPYVVFNEPPFFNPQKYGMKPLSVMAVVCNNQVWYGVWGDTNQEPTTGEASISLAQLCFPNEHLNGDKGHGNKDVLYMGFAGDDAVPGKNGAKWKARNVREFEDSIKSLGDRLVAQLPSSAHKS